MPSSQGTGSYPWPPQGWHLLIRLMASQAPLSGPYFFNASIAYWEQVGVNLQEGPSHGEMIHWYNLISNTKGKLNARLTAFNTRMNWFLFSSIGFCFKDCQNFVQNYLHPLVQAPEFRQFFGRIDEEKGNLQTSFLCLCEQGILLLPVWFPYHTFHTIAIYRLPEEFCTYPDSKLKIWKFVFRAFLIGTHEQFAINQVIELEGTGGNSFPFPEQAFNELPALQPFTFS